MDKLFWCLRNIASLVTLNGSFWVISSETVGCGACPLRRPPPGGCLCSSAGQSVGLINPRSWVRSPPRVFFFYACLFLCLRTSLFAHARPLARPNSAQTRPAPNAAEKSPTRARAKAPRRQAPQSKTTHNSRSMSQQKAAPRAAKALCSPSCLSQRVRPRRRRRAQRKFLNRCNISRRRTTASKSASVRSSWPRAARRATTSTGTRVERVVRDARDAADLRGVDGRAPGGHGLVQGVLDDGQRVRAARARRRAVVRRRSPAERRRGRVVEGVPARPTTRTGWRVTAARDVKPAPPKPRATYGGVFRGAQRVSMVFRCCASQEKRRRLEGVEVRVVEGCRSRLFRCYRAGAPRGSSSRAGLRASGASAARRFG